MGLGYLKVQVHTGDDALPVKDCEVIVKNGNGNIVKKMITDADGDTETIGFSAPDKEHTLNSSDQGPYYSSYEVDVSHPGFGDVIVKNIKIYDTITSILPVNLIPLPTDVKEDMEIVDVPPPTILLPIPRGQEMMEPYESREYYSRDNVVFIGIPSYLGNPMNPPENSMQYQWSRQAGEPFGMREVVIPDYITVHLGTPSSSANNVRVKFTEYLKNVASSEIYPTWPQAALEANIYAQISFALNRVFTEWYRSRGYNFDITSSPAVDQSFTYGREIYSTISLIVDRIFNSFVRRQGRLEPFFTQYCNGTTSTCAGLSQWGTVTFANQGLPPLSILKKYYPTDIQIVTSNNIKGITESYPGTPLQNGSSGSDVRLMQEYLNRIRANYPLIPQISVVDGVYGPMTERAVKEFQRTFNLTADGIIGRSTWNKIVQIFVAVTKLASLDSEGKRIGLSAQPPTVTIREGSTGSYVIELQFILNYLAQFYPTFIPVIQDGVFRSSTTNSVKAFQRRFNLTADGIVGPATWRKLYSVFEGIENNVEIPTGPAVTIPAFPGTLLRVGSRGNNVRLMQEYLNVISTVRTSIPRLATDGIFGPMTQSAVREFQRLMRLGVDGIIGPITWGQIVTERNRILNM